MSRREQWEQLSQELGFEFKRGIRGFLESAAGRRELDERIASGEFPKGGLALLDNPIVRTMLELLFDGVGAGTHRGYEFNVFSSTHQTTSSGSSTLYANVTMFFPKSYDLELVIYNETFLSRVGKALFFQQDVQLGNPELDKLIMIKGRQDLVVRDLLESPDVQRELLTMYRMSTGFEVRDYGIKHKEAEGIITRERAVSLMDRMVDVAESLPPP
jgi:hypothetical protein